ncbi:MAG: hypothetical protein AB7N76_35645 [Planctomycetota bacterium]
MSDEQTTRDNDVEITVTDISDELEGWDRFRASARNEADGPRTVNGSIQLFREDGGLAGECTVYLEVPPGESKADEFTVKVTNGPAVKWVFKVVKVYSF